MYIEDLKHGGAEDEVENLIDFLGHGTVMTCKALGEDVVESSAKRKHFADY